MAREFLHVETVPAPLVPELTERPPGATPAAPRIGRGQIQIGLRKDQVGLAGQPTNHAFRGFPVEGPQRSGGVILPSEAF